MAQFVVVEEFHQSGPWKIRVTRQRGPYGRVRVPGEPLHGCRFGPGVTGGQCPDLGILVVGEGGQPGGGEVRPRDEMRAFAAGVLQEAAKQERRRSVRMVLGQQDAYAEVVVDGKEFHELRWQSMVDGRLPAQQRVAGVCVTADGLGVAGHLGRVPEDEVLGRTRWAGST